MENYLNWIVLFGAAALAIERIVHLFKQPVDKTKDTIHKEFEDAFDKRMAETLPDILEKHAASEKEVRDKEHKEFLVEVEKIVSEQTIPYFEEIEKINLGQNEKIELLMGSSRDVLRQHIINIYERNKARKALSITEREFLDDCFSDYEKEHGNGYIAKLYHRMDDWQTLGEEEFV